MRIIKSNKLQDVVEVSERSSRAKTPVYIMELSSLSDLIPYEEAESIRQSFLDHGVQVRQLSNVPTFEPWTSVEGFVSACMQVRYISPDVLPIKAEVVIFDDTVTFYRVQPEVTFLQVEDTDFAAQQRALFEALWHGASPRKLRADGSTA